MQGFLKVLCGEGGGAALGSLIKITSRFRWSCTGEEVTSLFRVSCQKGRGVQVKLRKPDENKQAQQRSFQR